MIDEKALRAQLVKLLDFEDAHIGFDRAVKGIPAHMRGKVPPGSEHSLWQLLEHLRIAQADILEFCLTAKYQEKKCQKSCMAACALRQQPPALDCRRIRMRICFPPLPNSRSL